MVLCSRLRAMEPTHHGLKPLKPIAKPNLPRCKLICLGISSQHESVLHSHLEMAVWGQKLEPVS